MQLSAHKTLALTQPYLGWAGALTLYIVAASISGEETALLVHHIAWTLAPIAAGVSSWLAAGDRRLLPSQRRGWALVATACCSWTIGQLIWDYYTYFVDSRPIFPWSSKLFYLGYSAILLVALGHLADAQQKDRFTLQHLGNLGLVGCCLAVTVILALLEPASQALSPGFDIARSLAHCAFVALTFFAGLYYLWTQRWLATWIPMLLITIGAGAYSLGNFIYIHALIVGTYQPSSWVNTTWTFAFICVGLAAHVRRRPLPASSEAQAIAAIERRSRQLEATIPALLIILMVAVGMAVADQISPRVLISAALVLILFAFILGAREAWIQGESQRLTHELRRTNELLLGANLELQESEARVRDLNAHLEQRVADRTRRLQGAYEELDGFTYAVAHDLKAPLRAIDGFGHLLDETIRERGDERSKTYVERIRRGAQRMSALIEDLLAYSRIERRPLAMREIEIDRLVAELVEELVPEGSSNRAQIEIDVPSLRLKTDREAVALVLENLIDNALKFSRSVTEPRVAIRIRETSDGVEIVVTDNGIGFDMQYHEQIFKLFHRLHRDDQYQGTGLGLALVHKAIERLGGRVQAQSQEGEGAVFTVRVPRGT